MNDDRLDEVLREHAAGYNVPPEAPRDEMWATIQAALSGRVAEVPGFRDGVASLEAARARRSWIVGRVLPLAAAAAALLILGFGLGRMTTAPAPGVAPGVGVGAAFPSLSSIAAFQHLSRSESLLSLVSADAKQGRVDRDVGNWGRDLLLETRLLLDSRSVTDPAVRELLEDLELILAQVAVLSGGGVGGEARAREELHLVAEGLEDRDVLSRIQAVIPAQPGFTTQ